MYSKWKIPGILIITLALLVGCKGGQTSNSGAPVTFSDPAYVKPWESRYNAFLLLPKDSRYEIEKVSRDGGSVVNETYEASNIYVYIQHTTGAWFSRGTQERLMDRARFDKILADVGGTFDVTRLDNGPQGPVGYYAKSDRCKVARFGKRVTSSKIYDNDHGQFDTVVSYIGCRPSAPEGDVFIDGLDIATDEDKAAIREMYKDIERSDASDTSPVTIPIEKIADVRFYVLWEKYGDAVRGWIDSESSLLKVVSSGGVECQSTEPYTDIFNTRKWKLTCNDGNTAEGEISSPYAGVFTREQAKRWTKHTATGSDQSGNEVFFIIG